MRKTTHEKFRIELEKVFEQWNRKFGDRCFCKMGNEKHFYFVRYEGVGNPNSIHSYEDVIKLFKKDLFKIK